MASAYASKHATARPTTSADPERTRLDLQGLRGVAVLLVLLAHAGIPFLPGGFIGVDAFFVLSGYLITQVLLRGYAANSTIKFGTFYLQRARRILPTATLVLACTTIAGVILLGVDASRDLVVEATWSALFLTNVYLVSKGTDYFATGTVPSPYQQYWSLAVEEQFYLLWPLLLLLGLTLGRKYLTPRAGGIAAVGLITALSFSYSLRQTADDPVPAYYSTATRAWELGAGALLALLLPYLPTLKDKAAAAIQAGAVGVLLAGSILIGSQTPYPGLAALLPVTAAIAIIAAGAHSEPNGSPLRARALVFMGGISYAAYLWHWPLLVLPAYATGTEPTLAQALLITLVSIGLAYATTRFLENPLRRSEVLRGSAATTIGLAALLTLGPVIVFSPLLTVPAPAGSSLIASSPREIQSQVQKLASNPNAAVPLNDSTAPRLNQLTRDIGPHADNECMTSTPSSEVIQCTFGDPSGERHVIVFGDSHAGMWTPALDRWGADSGTRITLVSKTSCSPWNLSVWHNRTQKPHATCGPWREKAIAAITSMPSDLIIISGNVNGVHLYDNGTRYDDPQVVNSYWRQGVRDTLSKLIQTGVPVGVMEDVPAFTEDILSCLAVHREDSTECSEVADPATYLQRLRIEKEEAAKLGAHTIQTYDWFCSKGKCPIVINNIIAYRDNAGHITGTYSAWLANALGERLQTVMPFEKPAVVTGGQ